MKTIKAFLCVLTALLLVLMAGCAAEEVPPAPAGSEVWETMPALVYGVLEYEKLTVLPWYSGRCEATSQNSMAETETGFYCAYNSMLYYSERETPGYWVPVCSKPNCMHTNRMACDACIYMNRIVVRDDRIYYEAYSDMFRNLINKDTSGLSILSKAADGTNVTYACSVDEAALPNGGKASTYLSSNVWLYYVDALTADGSTESKLYAVTDNGTVLLHQEDLENDSGMTTVGRVAKLYGDPYYRCSNMYKDMIFRIEDDKAVTIQASLIPGNGGYLSGNTLRVFRRNDGYYDINIETLEEVKVADAQLADSDGQIYLPNCIVESTLLVDAMEYRTPGMAHTMKIFNGEAWLSVTLPSELVNAKESVYIYVKAITSDSIIFEYRDKEASVNELGEILYRISLDDENMVMKQL